MTRDGYTTEFVDRGTYVLKLEPAEASDEWDNARLLWCSY